MKQHVPIFVLACVFLTSCSSKRMRPDAAPSEGQGRRIALEARAQLQNKTEKKTYTMVVEAVAIEPAKLRIDLTGPFGASMGKLVMRGDQVGLLIPQQKKVYFGTASDQSFRPVLPMPLHPRDLMTFLLGTIPSGWSCQKKSETVESCQDPARRLILTRDSGPEGSQKKWSVAGDKFALTVLPTSVTTNVQAKSDTFSMPIPEGYSKHKLP